MTELVETLSGLPQPEVIEEVDFEAILARRLEVLAREAEAAGVDISLITRLRTDPARIVLEEASYAEMALRFRLNHMYRARLLYFATGADLDHVAEEYGVTRLEGESDADLRQRTRIKNRGSSSAGPDDWWRYHAMAADERVEDVAVTRLPAGPDNTRRGRILLSLLAQTAAGVASPEMIERVRAAVSSPAVRPVGVEVDVRAASTRGFDVRAQIWLAPEAPGELFDGLEERLRAGFASVRALGRDVTRSWLIAQLQQPGVHRVELLEPAETVAVAADEAARLDDVTLVLMGRGW